VIQDVGHVSMLFSPSLLQRVGVYLADSDAVRELGRVTS